MIERFKKILFFSLLVLLVASCSVFKKGANSEADPRVKTFNFNYYFLEANKQKILGNYNAALEGYQMALQVDPSQASVCYEIAGILSAGGDYSGAMQYAEQAVNLDKTDNKYYLQLLAYIYQNKNMLEKSVKVYEELLSSDPGNIQYYFKISNLYITASKLENAIKTLNRAEKQFGIQESISLEKENCYHSAGDQQNALKEIIKLNKAFPDNSRYKTILAESYVNVKDYESAGKIYGELSKITHNEGIIYFSIADYYLMIRDYETAFALLKKGYVCSDVDMDVKVKMTISLLDVTGKDKALVGIVGELLDILVVSYPEELMVRALNADFMMFKGDLKSAQKEFDFILERDKNKFEIWQQVLQIDFVLKDMASMYKHSKEAIELFPNVLEMYRFYIVSTYALRKFDEIPAAVDYASNLAVSDQELLVEFLVMQAEAYNELGQYQKSDSVFNLVLFKDAENISTLNNYSYFLANRGENLDKALKMSTQLIELEPGVPAYLDTHAWVLYKNKMFTEALGFIDKALFFDPTNVVFLEHKGDILFNSGNVDKAVEMWMKAAESGKGSDKLEQKIKTKTLID